MAQARIPAVAVKLFVLGGDLEIAVAVTPPTPIARHWRLLDLSSEERVMGHFDGRVLIAANSAYLRERGGRRDDPLDLLERLFRQNRAGVRNTAVEQKFTTLDPAVVLRLQVEDSGADVFQVFRGAHRPVPFEVPIVVELRLIYPDRHEMRRDGFAERLK